MTDIQSAEEFARDLKEFALVSCVNAIRERDESIRADERRRTVVRFVSKRWTKHTEECQMSNRRLATAHCTCGYSAEFDY
jgi:hypothetical protein